MNDVGPRALAASTPNLRRTRRLRVLQPAKIVFGTDMMIHCEVRDISIGGARIAIKQHMMLPDRFELFICAQDLRVHAARVRWRSGDFVGVSFGDEADDRAIKLPPAHQVAIQSYPTLATLNLAVPSARDDIERSRKYGRSASKLPRASVQVGAMGTERRRLRSRRGDI